MGRIRSALAPGLAATTACALVALAPTLAAASTVHSDGTNPVSPRYELTDLTKLAPAGYNTPIPVAVNSSGVVVGDAFSGGKPAISKAGPLAGFSPAKVHEMTAGTTAVPHVFVYAKGKFAVIPTLSVVTSAQVTGLNDAGAFAVVGCKATDCNHYYVVRPATKGSKTTYHWTTLAGADIGTAGLGPIAANGDVAGAIGKPIFAIAVAWRPRKDGSYAPAAALGKDPNAGTFARSYFPIAISSASGHELVGGNEDTPSFYPDSSPALWGPKFAHDLGYIGSVTTAMTAHGSSALATVGCTQPVPVCGPACPIKAQVDTVAIVSGLPKVTAKLTLDNPAVSATHCGVSPLGITVDPKGRPFTVGLLAAAGLTRWLPKAVIWVGKQYEMLTSQVTSAPSGTDLQWALGVNRTGQIIGTGTVGGVANSAWVLTPTRSW